MGGNAEVGIQFNAPSLQNLGGGLRHIEHQPRMERPEGFYQKPTSVPRGMFEAYIKTCQRWHLRLQQQAILLGYLDHEFLGQSILLGYLLPRTQDIRDRIGYVLAISLGLGALFNEDVSAERDWLKTEHTFIRTSPLELMLCGRMINLITVADIVRHERGL